MKKFLLSILLTLAFVVPSFSASISVERKKPAEFDLDHAKNISFLPVTVGGKYIEAQYQLGSSFISSLKNFAFADGKYDVMDGVTPVADVYVKVAFLNFDVHDSGATVTQKVDGEEVVIRDEWTRTISGTLEVTFMRAKDNKVLGTKSFKIFESNVNVVPKSDLPDPIVTMQSKVETFAFQAANAFFDTKYVASISLLDTKTKDKALKEKMKSALKVLKSKNYEKASELYKEIYDEYGDYAAGFNYSRTLQILHEFDAAKELMNALISVEGNKTVIKALADLEKDKAEVELIASRM